MRFGAVSTITLLSAVAFVACFPSSPMKDPTPGEGGSSGNGGSTSSSGGASNGGTTASGGSVGGNSASGGSAASGGTTAQGGITAQGGAGGTTALGGTAAAGGVRPTGGNTSGGGNGGVTPQGGTNAAGGASASNCTDEPPPNQTPTCPDWAAWNTCTADWFKTYCNRSCGRCTGGSSNGGAGGASSKGGAGGAGGVSQGGAGGSGNSGGGGVAGPGTTNPQITGTNGWVSRYWDCCKPSCAWNTNLKACQKDGTTRVSDKNMESVCKNGGAYQCYDLSPWYDESTNTSYGFVAHGGGCGTCYLLQFTGASHNGGANAGAAAIKGQQMIVQKINDGGDVGGEQFDLLVPGGGVGQFNGCSNQWGSSTDLGSQYGGLLSACKADPGCMKQKCQSVFGNMPALLAGCNWFTNWYSSADNPSVVYKQVTCPSQITARSGI